MKSVIQIYGVNQSGCGYCCSDKNVKKTSDTSVSYGFVSEYMLSQDYESLMLLGWRRSGTYYYKPQMHITCCPQFSIRLKVSDFEMSRDQKQILKRMYRFLETGDIHVNTSNVTKIAAVSNLNVSTEKACYTDEKFELYKLYQVIVHKDDPNEITTASFQRFLVDSPLIHIKNDSLEKNINTNNNNQSTYEYGTYHQLYRLNELLIAVGVIDLLPSGLSSVYLFYHPHYHHLVLGKYTVLKEIDFCANNGFEYYYMGFYIHSCPKMKYKGSYKPSELLCPSTFVWYPIKEAIELLNENKFTPLNNELACKRKTITNNEELKQFCPNFEYIETNPELDLDQRQLLHVKDLNQKGQQIVRNLLNGFAAQCGYNMIERFRYKFY